VIVAEDALRAVAGVRRSRADQAAASLARTSVERRAAADARTAAQLELATHLRRARGSVEGCRVALERGELSAGDLWQADACSRRSFSEEQALVVRVRRVAEREREAIEQERKARSVLLTRATDAKVAEAALARRDAARARRAEARAEDAACEAWRPRR
jgi:hypothetical protein